MTRLLAALALVTLLMPSIASAQRGPRGPRGQNAGQREGGQRQGARNAREDEGSVKPYDEVITDDVKTNAGLFLVHRKGEDVLYEIPPSELGEDMLWVTQVAETTAGSSYPGMPAGDRVVRWEQRGDAILFRDVRYNVRADTDDPISRAVDAGNLAPIIKVFPIVAYGKDKAPVIEVTDLFRSDVPEFSAQRTLSAGRMDPKRSFVEEIKAFPTNIETRVLATYAASGENERSSGISAMIHHSMVQLPKNPMTPRRHDERVGYFSVGFTDFADDSNHEAEAVRYITRWRLEKKDPTAEISDPVKPIVFYVGRNVPEKWQPYIKAGIEQWRPAFESAGFSNAIIGKYAPDPREDPNWDAEDARISTIRWLPADIANAFGPHVHDPRTGEILEADVRMYHNVQKLVRDWYFVQVAAVDERARKLPLPDDLMGELIQFVVAHEVGHSLGFPHNFKASSAYSIEQLRDAEWTRENGTAPSIMDYARFNYVAPPGDDAALWPAVGPYDHFATQWGYTQFERGADEKAELEMIARRQIDEPMYRFGGGGDPTAQTEDLSGDAIEATALGLANLERIAGFMVEATCNPGEDYDLLENMYGALFGQWNREMGHVANVVGGVEEINLFYGDAEQRYFMLDADYQREAVQFLLTNALSTPTAMMPSDIVMRLTADGVADRVLSAQRGVVRRLVSARRINRMAEHAELGGANPYKPVEMMQDIRTGLFSEFNDSLVQVDVYRRNLQRAYTEHLATALDSPAVDSDLPGLARHELMEIQSLLAAAADKTSRDEDDVHRVDLLSRIEAAQEPRRESPAPGAAGGAPPQRPRRGVDAFFCPLCAGTTGHE
jgi:hypothetical protein